MTVDVLSWQDIAHALTRRTTKPVRNEPQRHRGNRRIPQETVQAIRDAYAKKIPRAIIAATYGVSENYVFQVTENGLRDDERERLR